NQDAVGVLHAGNALGNDQLGGAGDMLGKGLADLGVGGGVHRAGGVVQNQDLGPFQQRPRNAQPLLLPAGHVGAALLDPGVVPVGEAVDELVGAGGAAGFAAFLLG